jgi:hypothetical protein
LGICAFLSRITALARRVQQQQEQQPVSPVVGVAVAVIPAQMLKGMHHLQALGGQTSTQKLWLSNPEASALDR